MQTLIYDGFVDLSYERKLFLLLKWSVRSARWFTLGFIPTEVDSLELVGASFLISIIADIRVLVDLGIRNGYLGTSMVTLFGFFYFVMMVGEEIDSSINGLSSTYRGL